MLHAGINELLGRRHNIFVFCLSITIAKTNYLKSYMLVVLLLHYPYDLFSPVMLIFEQLEYEIALMPSWPAGLTLAWLD